MYFAFDVDGTLTPSRQKISPDFAAWFQQWIDHVQDRGDIVLLVTGSDRAKTVEQLGEQLVDQVDYCCNCLGNTVYNRGKLIHNYCFDPPMSLLDFLAQQVEDSNYSERYGQHIEHRGAMINFSVVGRGAVGEQRTRYYEWDKLAGERQHIAEQINQQFEGICAQIGGETGLDIFPEGLDKRQVMHYMQDGPIVFFGDRLDDAGNDKPLADAIRAQHNKNLCYQVDRWEHTWEILQSESFSRLPVKHLR
jgi:phosphomannomutase